jgi:hypothetical protein
VASQNAFKGGWRDELMLLRQMLKVQDSVIRDVVAEATQLAGNSKKPVC